MAIPEPLKKILDKIKAWWDKFTSRQKTLIVVSAALVVFVFAILIYVTSQPQYTDLITCDTTASAAEVQELLETEGITYKASSDGLKFSVESSQYQTAVWALGSNGVGADEYTIQDALSGSITTTASDKEKLTVAAYESQLETTISSLSNVKSADVHLNIAEDNGTLIATEQESSAFIKLELDGTFTSANAANLAECVATWLGNDTTANITILDSDANLLFAGGDDYTTAGIASSMQELQNQGQSMIANQVKTVLLGTEQFSDVVVACTLDMDYATYEETVHNYGVADGREEGYLSHNETYDSTSENGSGAVPGTDSNDETTYVTEDYDTSSTTQSETENDYLVDEDIQTISTPAGVMDYDNSTMSIALIKYKEISEEDAESQGLLDGITWEEYKLANADDVKLEVDDDYYQMASNATKIPVDNITIVSYESPIFVDKESLNLDWTTILTVIMLIIILALLALVVLRTMSTKKAAQAEEEEELSVEKMLQSTPEEQLEDIDVETKSETRKMIEKFVDENPEAAAALLRNWLAEDW